MNPGRLKNRIEIQHKTAVRDPDTKITKQKWQTIHKCWAEIEQPTGNRFYQAAVAHLEYATWFKIRQKDGIKPGMRVVYQDHKYLIEHVKYDLQHKRFVSLQCKEVV
ncbi:phage head closure protein [Numidum massiliense]|uniref:phage head closure protein n=1 Tax=Numidum massiliense TaxID=1522315 RepID=UPI0006D5B450|nr:phage head closure protein [Numidum massiliense]